MLASAVCWRSSPRITERRWSELIFPCAYLARKREAVLDHGAPTWAWRIHTVAVHVRIVAGYLPVLTRCSGSSIQAMSRCRECCTIGYIRVGFPASSMRRMSGKAVGRDMARLAHENSFQEAECACNRASLAASWKLNIGSIHCMIQRILPNYFATFLPYNPTPSRCGP